VKVLIVDDSETLRSQLKKALNSIGLEVIEAADGMLGVEAFQSSSDIKLIISDVNMPNMDGLTMCSEIVTLPTGSSIPILMLTTEANLEMKTKGKQIGVKAWVTKPFNEEKLILAVKKLIGLN
jgi:two-component system, chemotaxis family, chemotaxis protein CheY